MELWLKALVKCWPPGGHRAYDSCSQHVKVRLKCLLKHSASEAGSPLDLYKSVWSETLTCSRCCRRRSRLHPEERLHRGGRRPEGLPQSAAGRHGRQVRGSGGATRRAAPERRGGGLCPRWVYDIPRRTLSIRIQTLLNERREKNERGEEREKRRTREEKKERREEREKSHAHYERRQV